MRITPLHRFYRSQLEAHIEEMIALLDAIDGDPDLEDGGDTEPNGDEIDYSGYANEYWTNSDFDYSGRLIFDGSGRRIARRMLRDRVKGKRKRATAFPDRR